MYVGLPAAAVTHAIAHMPDNSSSSTAAPNTDTAVVDVQPVVVPAAPTGPPQLRPYQVQLVNDLYRELNEGYKRVAIIAGTGAGKTIISGQICAHAEEAGKRLMFLVHLDVLVGQTYE